MGLQDHWAPEPSSVLGRFFLIMGLALLLGLAGTSRLFQWGIIPPRGGGEGVGILTEWRWTFTDGLSSPGACSKVVGDPRLQEECHAYARDRAIHWLVVVGTLVLVLGSGIFYVRWVRGIYDQAQAVLDRRRGEFVGQVTRPAATDRGIWGWLLDLRAYRVQGANGKQVTVWLPPSVAGFNGGEKVGVLVMGRSWGKVRRTAVSHTPHLPSFPVLVHDAASGRRAFCVIRTLHVIR